MSAAILETQQQTNWCWAACARMAGGALGCTVPIQCELASQFLGASGCCADGSTESCNKALDARLIPGLYAAFGMRASSAPITEAALQQALGAASLVLVLYDFGTSYHFALLVGYNGSFSVEDPKYGAFSTSYDQLASAYGMGSLINAWIVGKR